MTRIPRYTKQRAALAGVRADAEQYAISQGLTVAEAQQYADATMRRHAYIGPGFWVALVLAVPTVGLSLVIHLAVWGIRRKQQLGVAMPLERVKGRVVIR